MTIQADCSLCRRHSSHIKEIRILNLRFFGGSANTELVCPNCRASKEFVYIDDDNILRYNTVVKSSKGSIG